MRQLTEASDTHLERVCSFSRQPSQNVPLKKCATVRKLSGGSIKRHPMTVLLPLGQDLHLEAMRSDPTHLRDQTTEARLPSHATNTGVGLGAPVQYDQRVELAKSTSRTLGLRRAIMSRSVWRREAIRRRTHLGQVGSTSCCW